MTDLRIEQRHRDAAAGYLFSSGSKLHGHMIDGVLDDDALVRAFARFEASLRTTQAASGLAGAFVREMDAHAASLGKPAMNEAERAVVGDLMARALRHTPDTRREVLEEAAAFLRSDAKLCDCSAREAGECACGAWDDWKTVAMPTLVERFEDHFALIDKAPVEEKGK